MTHYKGAAADGGRAEKLMKKREQEQEEAEAKKRKIEEELALGSISTKFATHYDAIEQSLKTSTVGLVTLDEMKAKQENILKEREKQLAKKDLEAKMKEKAKEDKKKWDKKKITMLSFNMDDDEEGDDDEEDIKPIIKKEKKSKKEVKEEINPEIKSEIKPETDGVNIKEEPVENNDTNISSDCPKHTFTKKKKRLGMNPEVDTSFLPDRDRDEEENKLREQLRQEWVATQERIKGEEITITYSYWDGSGHRRQVKMKKGHTIQQMLHRCLDSLRKEFNDLKPVSVDQLMYVKEDLIIPHHYSFYDFIVTKARGKSGPLFSFDVHEDLRLTNDAKVEKHESHAGKVCLRSWYERNKHIFPASRWEPYDPEKVWDNYTISDKNAVKITVK